MLTATIIVVTISSVKKNILIIYVGEIINNFVTKVRRIRKDKRQLLKKKKKTNLSFGRRVPTLTPI